MEHERQNQPQFRLSFESGLELLCNKNNTVGFTHEYEPDGDHLYVYTLDDAGEIDEGNFVFRNQIPNFNEILDYMERTGFTIVQREGGTLNDEDRKAYEKYLKLHKPVVEPENAPQDELDWISPRKEQQIKNAVGFLLYLAQEGKL